jgi:hypothetical protein
MKTRILLTLSLVALLVVRTSGQLRESPLAAARALYASARYDEALAMLNGMQPSGSDRRSVEQYRSLCLLALGRAPEAERAIAAVVTMDPMFVPGDADASPRVRAAFSEVRYRLLPEIAASRYTAAKAAYDRKDYQTAGRQFREVVSLLDDPQMGSRSRDLRVLASGFLDLSTAAAAPPPLPKAEPKREERASAAAPAAARSVTANPAKVWQAGEAGVTAPVAIRQDVPRLPPAILSQSRDRGMLEIVIDEKGRVTGITIRTPVHPMYDPLLMTAARDWRYRPATAGGVPVKYRKLIQVVIDKR